MDPKLRIGKHIQVRPTWDSYIGQEVDSTIKKLEQPYNDSSYIVKEDSLGESGLRKVTMEGYDERIIIVGEKNTNSTWIVLDIFVSTIGKDEPSKPFK